ncbi:MAG: hypothetical protein A2428_03995 [Bdellovibrionales bacterium RIFOXYC1_FULL_54_43]|nr:MAG: hypothetical protein A2428_03995 [Bdellovibrionales bacterium RIFOXYC1_FULL_54_43]OFZ85674.1 MAG: hypothetical protein A2603_16780 [Bdellovibrionales bacterium RIFOXYD1_FULL_55_31]
MSKRTENRSPHQIHEVYVKIGKIAQTLGSPARLKILQLLSQSPRSVEQISEATGESIANTSQHLQRLAREGLLAATRQGLMRIYRIKSPNVTALWENLQDLAQELSQDLTAAETEITDATLRSPLGAREVMDNVRKNRAILVDVRESFESAETPVSGARAIPFESLKQELKTFHKDKTVYVFCRGRYCELASQAVRLLRNAGFNAFRLRESSFKLNQLATDRER